MEVTVIFCLEKRQDHLLEHLNWLQETHNLHLLGVFFVDCDLVKKE